MHTSTKLLLLALALYAGACRSVVRPTAAISDFDLNKHTGTWYEIARYPNWFEKDTSTNITVKFTKNDNGNFSVHNSFITATGEKQQLEGNVWVPDHEDPARLRMQFFFFLRRDFWVVFLDSKQRYAVITLPRNNYLWVISRTPQIPAKDYREILQILRKKNYDTTRLIKTIQRTLGLRGV